MDASRELDVDEKTQRFLWQHFESGALEWHVRAIQEGAFDTGVSGSDGGNLKHSSCHRSGIPNPK